MLQKKALSLLRSVSPYGEPLENHCVRIAAFTMALGERSQTELDPDLIYAACYLHDIGLLVRDKDEKNYLVRGLKYAGPKVRQFGLAGDGYGVFEDIMLYSHSLREIRGISPAGELARLAVRTEHSLGRISNGLDKDTIRRIFKSHPRRGFNRVLAGFFKTSLVDDGPNQLVRVFFPK